MDYQFPKRILEEGAETKIDKINNTCRRTILGTLKVVLRDEYQEVLKDPVFGPILAIVENKLIYSGKIIHSFICKKLKVSKLHELWFIFAKRPLRFSMQEFYDVTGLKFKEEPDVDFNNWKSDKGFWSTVLKENRKINLLIIRDELLKVCNEWTYVDRVRLVYLCIIHGFVIAKDLRVFIPHEFIRLVMDFEKMRMYPWGLGAYDELIASIFKAREDVHLKNSYVLDGFSYAFQIWIMEAIPNIGSMGELFPFISSTGSSKAIDNVEFFREDEKNDGRVGRIVALIKTHVEEPAVVAEEPVVVTKRGKRKLIDPGVESRKKQLLCQWTGEHNIGVSGEMKTFIEGLFTSTFNSFKELLQKDIQECFDKVDNEMAQLKETMSQITGPSNAVGRDRASEILCPSTTLGKDQDKSSQSPGPSGAKGKGKGKAAVSVDPPPLRRSPRPVRKEVQTDDDDMFDFLKNLSQSSNYVDKGMQESLQDAMRNLSQASHVKVQPPDWRPPTLKDEDLLEDRVHDSDHSLVFAPEDSWAKLNEWSSTSNELKIGPSMLTSELAAHVMGPTEWLKNHVLDCEGLKYNKEVEPFAFLIPRIFKAAQSSKSRQQLKVKQYTVSLDFSLVNDNNIREARQKIAYDLWETANDPELILRMAQYTPPKTITNPLVELE
ncbi:hypothetical protein DY000_02061079 [Brassica cretica]|uniref:DUF1985 domain-containing protein n=1 Tax=Brassica cretica TaxID=69181 RepID=A0ABQ7AXB6_BRACR|nr:hypothetical protein DY000_02061079 [Brassica cretica]